MTDAPAATDNSQPHGEYVVVARRYRPQTFEELIGQQHVSQALSRAIASERVGHAYLFTGARGVGKTSAARILAKALNCAQGTSPTPCNQCEICESVSTGDDVDVLEIDGASNRGIDEIRQLRQNVAVRPSRCRFKIYIIDEVHMLTKEAFNALLKTLEEPPEHVKFIFATTEPNKIPVTILSRCQRYDFAGIEAGEIQERLSQIATTEGVTIDEDALQILAMRAAGSMRDSQSLLEQLLSTGTKAISSADVTKMLGIAPAARLSRLVLPLVDRNAAEVLAELDAAITEGAEVSQLLDQLLGYFRDVMTQTVGCDETQMLYALPGQRQEVREVAEKLGVQTLLAIVQILDQTAARMRVSTHTRTLAEMAIVRVCHLADLDEIATLINELKRSPGEQSLPAVKKKPAVKKNDVTNAPANSPLQRAEASPPPVTPAPAPTPVTPTPVTPAPVAEDAPARPPSPAMERPEAPTAVATPATATAVAEEPKESTLPLSAENVDMIWKQVLGSLSGMVADIAAEVGEVAVDEKGRFVASFSQNFHREVCEKPGNRSRIETALRTACGQEVPLVFRALARTDSAQPIAAPKPSRRQQQAEVAAEPFVRKAMELFDGDPSRLRYVPPQS